MVVAFGGDGTVNEAANGLRGSDTPLCALPGGSANVFAKMLGIPGELVDATEHLLAMADDWRVRRVDLGVVNGRCFAFNSGVGLDASVVERVDARPDAEGALRPLLLRLEGASRRFVRRYLVRAPRMHVERRAAHAAGRHDDRAERLALHLLPRPPGRDRRRRRRWTPAGSPAPCCTARRPLGMALLGLRALSPRSRVVGHRNVTGLRELSELTVRSADGRPLPLQVDGDFLGDVDEARYSILPRALQRRLLGA